MDKKNALKTECPCCGDEMQIRELECPGCNVQVRGHFGTGSRYDQLSPELTNFLETFLKCRGVLRDVEAALGMSYPTVRARLDSLLSTLGFGETSRSEPAAPAVDPEQAKLLKRKAILAALDAGKIDAASALEALSALN